MRFSIVSAGACFMLEIGKLRILKCGNRCCWQWNVPA